MRLHKYVLAPQRYCEVMLPGTGLDPLVEVAPQLALAVTLMTDRPLARDTLSGSAAEAADHLVAAGLLREEAGRLRLAHVQLVSVGGVLLFVDAELARAGAPTFPVPGPGVTSPLLAHYLDVDRAVRSPASLDLSTGPGMLALLLARHAPRVVATDEAPAQLALAALNRALNQRETAVELRQEGLGATLARGERFAMVTANPWTTPFPDGLEGPLYGAGASPDGLDPVREVVAGLPDLLLPGGVAYLVAELVGDDLRPFFLAELERTVTQRGLIADVYIEGRVDQRISHAPFWGLTNGVARQHGWDRQRVFERVKGHFAELGAACRFLTVLVLRPRGALPPRMRVLNRFHKGMFPMSGP